MRKNIYNIDAQIVISSEMLVAKNEYNTKIQ